MKDHKLLYRTIDDLVSAPRETSDGKIENNIWLLVRYDTDELIETLNLASNIPSEWDLLIIRYVLFAIRRIDKYVNKWVLYPNLIKVLEIYRDRKVIQ